jgi:NDP-mannose synthase
MTVTVTRGAAKGLRAVMPAGGKGVRLRPFTANFPKPLVPLGDLPIIELVMKRLVSFGITDITLTLGHLAELIKAYFLHRQEFTRQLNLRYVDEEKPTGTVGSLACVPDLDNTFLVMNSDVLTDLDLDELVTFHRQQGSTLTIAMHERHVKIDLGVIEFDHSCRVTGYREKPEHNYHVSMGIYIFEPRALSFIERGKYLDFPDLVFKLLEAGEKVCARPCDCKWLDIGRPDDYAKAQELIASKPDFFRHD